MSRLAKAFQNKWAYLCQNKKEKWQQITTYCDAKLLRGNSALKENTVLPLFVRCKCTHHRMKTKSEVLSL